MRQDSQKPRGLTGDSLLQQFIEPTQDIFDEAF
jgi:hypothetical protein